MNATFTTVTKKRAKDVAMAAQEHKKRPASARESTTENVDAAVERVSVTDDVDDLLDEIDEVLEQNAEDFVKSYVQKGGE